MEGLPTDLQTKYQKLASEYSKIRAQAAVLKKAVVDEQSKAAELKETLKERDQSLRKADQEMESLSFRNQQLTKRVSFLQEELESIQNKNKKGKANASVSEDNSHFFDQELEKQISHNARLMFQIQEKEEEHSRQTQQLMEKVQSLEREVKRFQRATSDVEAKYKVKLDALLTEKISLKEKVGDKERDVQQYSAQVAALQLQQERLKSDLGNKLQTASDIISTRLPFIDSKKHDLNELNVPTHNRQQHIWSLSVISQVGNIVHDLTSQLSDFHTYTEQRIHAVFNTLSPLTLKFSVHLKENAKYLRALEQGYKDFQAGLVSGVIITLETIPSLHCVADKLDKYNSYLQKLLPYQLLSLDEENTLLTCGERLQIMNEKLSYQISLFTNSFMKLNSYVNLLSFQSKKIRQHPLPCQRRFLEELIAALEGLYSHTTELSATYKEKCQIESDMPTTTERLRTTNECLINSLTSMVNSTKELYGILFENKSKLLKERRIKGKSVPLKTHPVVTSFKSRAASYIKCLEEDEPESVPYDEALRQREYTLGGAGSREVLGEQLQNVQQRATQLEQDREHWRQEFQLLKMKHSKELQRNKELEEQLQLSISSATTPQSDDSTDIKTERRSREPSEHTAPSPAHSAGIPSDQISLSPTVTAGLLGQVTCPIATSAEAEARELEVKSYFTERINELVAERQVADGKAISLQTECIALHERLKLTTEQLTVAEERRKAAEVTLGKLQEELHTTTHNYESQLSMMSDHLANMNEKLAVQKDEIDQLKYQLGQKVPKKGKQK